MFRVVPGNADRLQVAVDMAGAADGQDAFPVALLREPNPGHAIPGRADHDLADLLQQLILAHRPDQGVVRAAHRQ